VLHLAFTPDGQTLLSAGEDGTVRLWDVKKARPLGTLAGHKGAVRRLFLAPSGQFCASASDDGSVKLWDLTTHAERATLPAPASQFGLAFAPDSKSVAIAPKGETLQIFAVPGGGLPRCLRGDSGVAYHLAYNSSGNMLAAHAVQGNQLLVWDIASGNRLYEWRVPGLAYAYFAADGRHLLVHANGALHVLRLAASPGPA
jgi:WD40 repeat protein